VCSFGVNVAVVQLNGNGAPNVKKKRIHTDLVLGSCGVKSVNLQQVFGSVVVVRKSNRWRNSAKVRLEPEDSIFDAKPAAATTNKKIGTRFLSTSGNGTLVCLAEHTPACLHHRVAFVQYVNNHQARLDRVNSLHYMSTMTTLQAKYGAYCVLTAILVSAG
jgi:hypothetical protein